MRSVKLTTFPVFRRALTIGLVVALAAGCVDLGPPPSTTPRESPTPLAPGATVRPGETSVPTPTPINTHGGPTPPPIGPGATIDPGLAAQIDEVIGQVPAVRGLDPRADVPYEFITREQFQEDLIELAFEEIPEETRAAEERLLKRLGLLADDADLEQMLLDLYGGQVAAFFHDRTDRVELSFVRAQLTDDSIRRALDFDFGLVGLDGGHDVTLHDAVTRCPQPCNKRRFLGCLTDARHADRDRHQRINSRTVATMSAVDGAKASTRCSAMGTGVSGMASLRSGRSR